MKRIIFILLILLANLFVNAQSIYVLKSGNINFFAGTAIEDIDATNTKLTSFLNTQSGEVVVSFPNNQFVFKRALMQEHFNENYIESEKFPKSQFKGIIINKNTVDLMKDGEYLLQVAGNLNIHGITQKRIIDFNWTNNGGKINVYSKFKIALTDHKIDRPQIIWEKLADTVQVSLQLYYEIYKK